MGYKPEKRTLIGQYYFQSEFSRKVNLSVNINRIEPVEVLVYLNEYQGDSAKIEIKSLHSHMFLHLMRFPVKKELHTVYHLKNEKYNDIVFAINKDEAILEIESLKAGSIFSKVNPSKRTNTEPEGKSFPSQKEVASERQLILEKKIKKGIADSLTIKKFVGSNLEEVIKRKPSQQERNEFFRLDKLKQRSEIEEIKRNKLLDKIAYWRIVDGTLNNEGESLHDLIEELIMLRVK